MYPPPPGQSSTGQQDPTQLMGFGDLHAYSIVDQLQVPAGIEPGAYVLYAPLLLLLLHAQVTQVGAARC